MTFLAAGCVIYAAVIGWLASHLHATPAEWGYSLAHLLLAAAINAHLLYVARRRSLSLLGSAPLAFLIVSHVYFTVNGLKYFSPILLYPQFELSLGTQFAGSALGALVLFLCALLLRWQRGPSTERMHAWIRRYWPDLRRLMFISVAGSLACKFALYRLGYGSTYTDTAYTEHAVRTYADYFVLLGNDTFGALSLVLGFTFLVGSKEEHPAGGFSRLVAGLGVFSQVIYSLLYLKARMIVLISFVTLALTAEVASRRWGERMLRLLFLAILPLSLLGVKLTLLIGRVNLPEDTGLRLSIAAVNRRADLTDFATAIVVNSHGEAHDVGIVSAAVLNAIPRFFYTNKEAVVHDVYSEILEQRLGWPAGAGPDMLADYQDSIFSAGVMAFGVVGFLLAPLGLVLGLYGVSRILEQSFHGLGYGITILALWLSAMHTEVEFATIPLNFRQAASVAIIAYALAWLARLGHQVVVLASRPPSSIAPAQVGAR